MLVDGLHTAEQAYRDVDHALEHLAPGGDRDARLQSAIGDEGTADDAGSQGSNLPDWDGYWNGDVWKAVMRLRTREDINVAVMDCDHGLGIVTRGVPDFHARTTLLTGARTPRPPVVPIPDAVAHRP